MLYLVLYECFKRGPLCHNQVARDRCATNQATKRFRAALRFANRFGHLLVGSVSPADRYNRERRTAIKWKLIRCGAARPPFRVKPGHACCLLGCSVGIDQARVVCFSPPQSMEALLMASPCQVMLRPNTITTCRRNLGYLHLTGGCCSSLPDFDACYYAGAPIFFFPWLLARGALFYYWYNRTPPKTWPWEHQKCEPMNSG